MKAAPPIHAAWEITRRCNAECLHCASASGPDLQSPEPNTSEALHIIDQLADAGIRVLAFSGGEPLLREDLACLVRHAVLRGLTTNLCTNGTLVDDAMALRLKRSGLHSITVSLDGACAQTHDTVRRFPGLFDRAVAAIHLLVKHGHHVGLSFTPTLWNYREAAEVVQLAYALGTDSVCVSQYIPTGRGTRDLMLSPGLLGDLAREVLSFQAHYARRLQIHCHDCHAALLLPPDQQATYQGCGAGTATVGIRADGTLTPCIYMPNQAGNLHRNSFADIWQTAPLLHELRDRDNLRTGNCGPCQFRLVCGGCRAAAMAIHGNPLAGDPSCWMYPEPDGRAELCAANSAALPR